MFPRLRQGCFDLDRKPKVLYCDILHMDNPLKNKHNVAAFKFKLDYLIELNN